ncbi:hypothetical protein FFWV33_13610 [Flavobacterium faecale]|uniref:Biopolymer transporter ExbD n=1 Tax=Flavobacterium faecale TaxID=1355330 RepID=A0A2S1LFK6_9FLAO|nr:biopolymer transporter ExbD [Flavobacterium faecale]AWG22489.1 hypothetical protein FFWV33_13610 [Flavobacterium faecale]
MKNLNSKIRSKKLNNRVDLTAMTSISFLLLMFFMVSKEMGKSRMIEYTSGNDWTCGNFGCYNPDPSRIITILLGEEDTATAYQGTIQYPVFKPKQFDLQQNDMAFDIKSKNKLILKYSAALGKPDRGAIVIIKPSSTSKYGNLIAVLDLLEINKIDNYSIVNEFTPEERVLLKKYKG